MADELSELDLHAYVDDQLDMGRRYAVEVHLSVNPPLASRVMGDLSHRTALRVLAGPPAGERRTPVRRAPIAWRRIAPIGGGLALAAAACALLLLPGGQPAYVDMAVASHRVAVMRAHMVSQIEAPALDAREILASTRIDLPALPADWQVTDVQLFPTGNGPAILVAVRTGTGQQLSLFALRERSSAPETPDAVREGSHAVAYWRRGDMSYALTGDEDPRALDRTAESLALFWS